MPEPKNPPSLTGAAAERDMQRLTRRSFTTGAIAATAGLGTWAWLTTATPEDGVPWPLRRLLRFNQWLAEGYSSPRHLAPTFPRAVAQGPARTNGDVGLTDEVRAAGWQLRVQHAGRGAEQAISLLTVQQLPRTDLVTELKCVEGWSEVMHFGGARFLDFVTQLGLATRSGRPPDPQGDPNDLYRYVYLATPDESYYVGLDMASALHPQTMLCDTMNGQPLTGLHGAPLRLYLTVKYGYKSLKRIGLIRFQDERPPDYWADRGYDWYAGL
ncbi:MAG TPA: molybdopterin-dependent oxidoreductase [Gemmataceae bacterium]|nr:molybdopterin-dependent oxidoreductase [Gemmataceae bacterium]